MLVYYALKHGQLYLARYANPVSAHPAPIGVVDCCFDTLEEAQNRRAQLVYDDKVFEQKDVDVVKLTVEERNLSAGARAKWPNGNILPKGAEEAEALGRSPKEEPKP